MTHLFNFDSFETKMVFLFYRFADVFGLDLADVKTFLDEVPKIPKSAYKDLTEAELSDIDSEAGSSEGGSTYKSSGSSSFTVGSSHTLRANRGPQTSLVPMFNQPGGFANFFDLIHTKKVCLENAYMADKCSIKGTIRVQNIHFQKKVTLKYTTNEWIRSFDLETKYLDGSCDGFSDKFTFYLSLGSPLAVGQRVQFCIRYLAGEDEHWDNNDGKNYVFQCLALGPGTSAPITESASKPVPAPIPMATPRATPIYNTSLSQSPSAMSDDPWFRYL